MWNMGNYGFDYSNMDYISYHAWMNESIIYKGDYMDKYLCPKCGHDQNLNKEEG